MKINSQFIGRLRHDTEHTLWERKHRGKVDKGPEQIVSNTCDLICSRYGKETKTTTWP